jgi:hypothetical protein
MTRVGRGDEFTAYASSVRASNSRRPAFLELFNRAHMLEGQPAQPDDHVPFGLPEEQPGAVDRRERTRPQLRIVGPEI